MAVKRDAPSVSSTDDAKKPRTCPVNDNGNGKGPIRGCPFKHHSANYRSMRGEGDGPAKCTWYPGTSEKSPHHHEPMRSTMPKIMNNILDHIGNTPLVRVNKITQAEDVECEILAKCEFFNAGGSVKDRIGKRMIEDAEKSGRIKPGDTIIEPTSGNTGIGLALAAAVKGYKMIVTLPEKMSAEKVNVLKALGAEIVRTPTEAAWDSPESHIGVANRLNKEIPNSHILDQYANPSNPLAHYDGTAEEILHQCDNKVDMVVMGSGTGGTLTGVARKLKEKCPNCVVVGVDPVGSILAEPDCLNDFNRLKSYTVEGTGYDFIPTVLDREIADVWVKTSDQDSLQMSRRLIKEEGLLCGGSSGGSMWAAVQMAKKYKMGKDKRIVVVLADSVRNYMTKFLVDKWMVQHKFLEDPRAKELANTWWASKTVADLCPSAPITCDKDFSCKQAIQVMKDQCVDQLPVVDKGKVVGVVTDGNLQAMMLSGRVKKDDTVEKVVFKNFKSVALNTPLVDLAGMFDEEHFALVMTTQKVYTSQGVSSSSIVAGVVSRIDLINFTSRE